ncbi:glycosyltransferase, partial [Patescibacteria group bacterium]|nr:glycosyltransferase [Patescibacteria group bacterium]
KDTKNTFDFNTLIIAPFPRSIKYEGIKQVALGYYHRYENINLKPLLVVPMCGDVPPGYKYHCVLKRKSFFGSLLIFIRMACFIYKCRESTKTIVILENSLATPFLTIFTRSLNYEGMLVVHFLCPVLVASEVFKVLVAYREKQIMLHLLLNNFFFAKLSSLLLSRNGNYFVGSNFQKVQLEKYGIRSKVINPYANGNSNKAVKHSSRSSRKSFRLGYLGHFSGIKGVDLLINAFNNLSEEIEYLELFIAWSGLGGEREKVTNMIRNSKNFGRIFQYGIVKPLDFLCDIDLLVLPYKINSVPIPPAVLHEAFVVGTKVLISDTPGLAGLYESGCSFFKANNLVSLEKEVVTIITHGRQTD